MGNCETSDQPMTPLSAPDSERGVLNNDIRHIDLQESKILVQQIQASKHAVNKSWFNKSKLMPSYPNFFCCSLSLSYQGINDLTIFNKEQSKALTQWI